MSNIRADLSAVDGRGSGKVVRILVVALLGLCLVATPQASARTRMGDDFAAGLERLRRQDERVAKVSFALRRSITDLCPLKGPLFGWTLHNVVQYSPRVRQGARAHFRFVGDLPSIMVVVPGSPAANAGLRPDDVLLAANGVALGGVAVSERATFEPLRIAIAKLVDMAAAPIVLSVQRDGAVHEITLRPQSGCAYETQVDPSSDLQASADAHRVFITSALVDLSQDDDELAAILGHEYGHIVLGHPPDALAPLSDVGGVAPRRRTVDQEFQADLLGLRLARLAGYDPRASLRILGRLGRAMPWLEILPSNHPLLASRRRQIERELGRTETELAPRPGRPGS